MCSLLCRLCLSDSVELYNIWSVVYDGVQADAVIHEIFNIQIEPNDDVTVMCPTCKINLGDFYKFFKVVKRSQRTLDSKLGQGDDYSTDNKVSLQKIVPSYGNSHSKSSAGTSENVTPSKITQSSSTKSPSKVTRVIDEIDLRTQSIGINPEAEEIEIKMDPISSDNIQTINMNDIPNKMIVQKVSNNFKIINNTGTKKVTRIILAKNIPANLLTQKDIVQKIVNNALAKDKLQKEKSNPLSTTTLDSNNESEEDEPLIKTKSRLIKNKAKKLKTDKKGLKKSRMKKLVTTTKQKNGKKVTLSIKKEQDETCDTSQKSKLQLARLLAEIEEQKKAKAAMKLSKTEYDPGPPDYDPVKDENVIDDNNSDASDMEIFDDENRKLTPPEVEQVYKNGKLIAQGADLENLYRRIFGLECEICERKFKTLSGLFSHYKEIHKGSGFIRCCKHKFYTRYSVNRHLVKHIRPRSVECPICKKVISRKKSLGVHMQVHLPMDQRRYQCGQCKLGFTHMAQLSHHVARRHSDLTNADLYQCDICYKKFTTKPVHDYHRRSVHKEATDLCQECGKTFKTVASLNAHIKRVHTEGGDPRMKCPHCTSICKKSNLKIHIKTVHEHIRKPCPHCDQLIYPKSMRSHIKHKHNAGLLYPCGYCEKRFKCEKYLKFHIVQHTGVPNYICEYCPKTFASSGNYHTHRKRVHKRELDRIAQEKLMDSESVPVYNPDEEKRMNSKQIDFDPQLLQSIRYKNPTIFTIEQSNTSDTTTVNNMEQHQYVDTINY